jgi:hypothetical protein
VWESALDGRRLRFHLAGINNQNFIMRDEETGTWWQQVNGRAILGPMKGRQLKLIPADIVAFGVWKLDHPKGRVLAPDPAIEARGDEYARSDWERFMARRRVVTTLPKGSAFEPRTLVVGIHVNGHAKAYALNDLRASRVLLDVIDDQPVLIVAADDGRSVRVFDRRIEGRAVEFAATPTSLPITSPDAGPATPNAIVFHAPVLIDLDTASEWDFAGRAISGPLAGKTLTRLPHLLEYWFDWQTYWPKTEAYKPWRPTPKEVDRLEVPKPIS